MKNLFEGERDYRHGSAEVLGVLLLNLGTPDQPDTPSLRRYLKEFLWDPRVVEASRPLWWMILNGIILRTRPAKSAEAYREIWDHEGEGTGSPLLDISYRQMAGLERRLSDRFTGPVEFALGMRYGNPSVASALEQLQKAGARRIVVLPLYPQYAGATTASTFDAVVNELKTWRWIPELRFINHYHRHPGYIRSLANSVREHFDEHGEPDLLLTSYHGVPLRYVMDGDPYHCECHVTTRLMREALEMPEDKVKVTFQSLFGKEEWVKPYTDETIKSLPGKGVKKLAVMCPGFSADCLETIEEIEGENREYFMEAGGEEFQYIPALNDREDHLDALADLIAQHCRGWPEAEPDYDHEAMEARWRASRERALAMGAKQ